MNNKLVALVLSVLATNPAAALSPAAALPRYSDVVTDSRARAVAVYANGDVLFLGHSNGFPGGPVLVRMDPAMGTPRWRKPLAGYSGMQAYCLVIAGETAYVGGSDIAWTTGRIVAVNGAGDVTGAWGDGSMGQGFRALAVDPVDASIWGVGPAGSAPTKSRVVHLTSALGTISSDDYFAGSGSDAWPYALAVTADRVYVGGSGYDISVAMNRAWIMTRSRNSAARIWEKFQTTLPNYSVVTGLAASGDDVHSFVSYDIVSMQTSMLFKNDPATGAFSGQTTLISNAPMTQPAEYSGGVVRHPSLPLVIASTANGFKCFKPDLTEIPGAAGTFFSTGLFVPAFVAVSNTLEFSVYGAMSVYEAAFYRFNAFGVRMSDPFAGLETKSKLIVAPNRLDLTKASAKIRFVLKPAAVPATGEILIYDLAGHLLIAIPFNATHGATADVLWDGKREDGTRVGTGGYLAIVDGEGFETGTDRALFVITGAAK